ncbi:MAG: flagellar assembly peptidoglycan hydrolase FlgJ [Gammaproteobacteria bacterium]|nr:flagellar assembly peptidoglycan hydrolase FlgJ [Gammaproteobacteria bacterium]
MALNTHVAQTAIDFNGLSELRRSATIDQKDQETLRQVAGQFESLFLNMMLKSMRQASLADGIFDSSQSDMYRDMSDQQLAMDLSAKGGMGLQDVIMRQLGGQLGTKKPVTGTQEKSTDVDIVRTKSALQVMDNPALLQQVMRAAPKKVSEKDAVQANITFNSPESFVKQLLPMAQQAANRIGVKPEVILSQAALETGWGKHVINKPGGKSSHNLFNIKADRHWQGDIAATSTVEYREGVAVKEQARFRSYESYQDSFNDYVDFLQTQPRYREALQQVKNPEAFIDSLHEAGYATDPAYADKIKRIMHGATLAQVSQELKYS